MNIKKILSLILSFGFSLSLIGCHSVKFNADEFDAYLDQLPHRFLNSDSLDLEYLFVNPQNYGFEETLLTLPYSDEDTYQKMKEETELILKELKTYDYDTFSNDQKLTYDILKDNLERSLLTIDYYDLDNSYLGSFVSFQAQLPFLLDEYNFESSHDLASYFNVLESSVNVFHKYVEIEKNRQTKGVGMTKSILKKTIEQCENFSNSERIYLIDSINAKIDKLEFLTNEEKVEAKIKNEDLLMNQLVVAYRNTKDELTELLPTAIEDTGLSGLQDGKQYYEALLKQRTGLDMDISEIKNYLEEKENEYIKSFQSLILKNPEIMKNLDLKNIKYTDFTSVEETLSYLQTQIFKDFPDLDEINFKVSVVDESMKDNFSPAAYLQSRIDSPLSTKEAIIINGDYTNSIFPTIAHEGFPGHMYQNVYFKQMQLPTIRYLLDYNGYSEGWATYVEGMSSKYATEDDKASLKLFDINTKLVQISMCLFDIGIHYEGWDHDEFIMQLETIFGKDVLTDEEIQKQYEIFLETPTNYLQYYLTAMHFEDIMKKASSELGTSYNPKEFHEVLLKTGPSPFYILEEQVDKYIESKSE